MSKLATLREEIKNGVRDNVFACLYGNDKETIEYQKQRYTESLDAFEKIYPEFEDVEIFSAPGRTEVGGNHTDHNFGKALAAGINLDVIGIVAKDSKRLEVQSKGFEPDILTLDSLEYKEEEKNKAFSLIKGVCDGFKKRGYNIGGFVAYTTSNVLKGSGMSSSAAFEVLLCTILNVLYNDTKIDPITVAQISQYAENEFFGKPCGLLDQMASSVGGFITIDFEDPKSPVINKIDFDFSSAGHALCIVDTGGNHSDLTHEYAAIPAEMKSVAGYYGRDVMRGVTLCELIRDAKALREKFSDRALLRAIHFVNENDRVDLEAQALNENDFDKFLNVVKQSGRSSFMYLQNVYTSLNTAKQGLSLALCISDSILKDKGAYRVHGGGFGGTIQAFVPMALLKEYKQTMDAVFGEGNCKILNIRKDGGVKVM